MFLTSAFHATVVRTCNLIWHFNFECKGGSPSILFLLCFCQTESNLCAEMHCAVYQPLPRVHNATRLPSAAPVCVSQQQKHLVEL